MNKTSINPMPQFYDRYINLIPDVDLSQAFDESLSQLNSLDLTSLTALENRPYAEGKWTVQELLQHILDWERIFAYRALLFARRIGDPPQSMDEDIMAANSRANERSVNSIVSELQVVRRGTISLFDGFDDATLTIIGRTRTAEISVVAVGFTIIGHQMHHINILNDRYLPLLDEKS